MAENFVYSRTRSLALTTNYALSYQMTRPFLKNFIEYGIKKDLPSLADANKVKVKELLNTFVCFQIGKNLNFCKPEDKSRTLQRGFAPEAHPRSKASAMERKQPLAEIPSRKVRDKEKLLPSKKTLNQSAAIGLSFGKDSLLSYGVAKEIGLDCHPVYVKDTEKRYLSESYFKKLAYESFVKEQCPIDFISDNIDNLFFNKEIKNKILEIESTNGIIAFVLEIIPLAYHYQSKYIIIGNERNLNNFFLDEDEFKVYTSSDQTLSYTKKENQCLQKLTDANIQVVSLIEPLYYISELKLLYHRYPNLLKYITSCPLNYKSSEKWCYQCPTCGKSFLYSVAIDGDPKKMRLKKNLFAKKYKNLYFLLASKNERIYKEPPQERDEELLAFLLAYRQGHRGALIDLFKQKYLGEAKKI